MLLRRRNNQQQSNTLTSFETYLCRENSRHEQTASAFCKTPKQWTWLLCSVFFIAAKLLVGDNKAFCRRHYPHPASLTLFAPAFRNNSTLYRLTLTLPRKKMIIKRIFSKAAKRVDKISLKTAVTTGPGFDVALVTLSYVCLFLQLWTALNACVLLPYFTAQSHIFPVMNYSVVELSRVVRGCQKSLFSKKIANVFKQYFLVPKFCHF